MDHDIISGDSHVNPDPRFWSEYLPERLRDRAPRIESDSEGDYIVFEDTRRPFTLLGALAGTDVEDYKLHGKLSDTRPGGWDPAARLEDQDIDGVQAEVLYGGGPLATRDPELRLASFRAYNDWLADFCSASPRRLLGIGYVPTDDVDRAIEEVRHIARRGLSGMLIPPFPPDPDAEEGNVVGGSEMILTGSRDRSYAEERFDPLWRAVLDEGMAVHMHLGARPTRTHEAHFLPDMVMSKLTMAEPLALFIFGGLLERYPQLKLVSVESGIGWMPFVVHYMDHLWHKHRHWTGNRLPEPPSVYFRRQILGTFLDDPVGVRERAEIGVENILWSSDYPHGETTWPNSHASIERHFEGVPEEDRYKITYENAARLYHLI
ncbi:MAG: amidohydrolase [Proteobacteria bacterium]|nr:amidohydrolase [Pseudomonadota bacterium]